MNPAQPLHATAADGAVPTAADRAAMPANAASITAVVTPAAARPLEYLPVGLFGSVMGLTGLGVAWRLAQARYGAPGWVADFFSAIAVIAFVALCLGYAVKLLKASDAVRAELRHPIAGNMFGTFWVSLLLLPIVVAPVNLTLARALWVIGTVGMFVFAWALVSRADFDVMESRGLIAAVCPRCGAAYGVGRLLQLAQSRPLWKTRSVRAPQDARLAPPSPVTVNHNESRLHTPPRSS